MTGAVSSRDPVPGSLEPRVPGRSGAGFLSRLQGLALVPGAPGRFERRLVSDAVVVRGFRGRVGRRPGHGE